MLTSISRSDTICILPATSRVPSLSTDEVASVPPGHGVLAAFTHGVLGRAAAISPPRVKVAVVVSLGAGSGLTLLKKSSGVSIVTLSKEVEGSSEDAGGSHRSEEERLERDHFVLVVADLCWMQ